MKILLRLFTITLLVLPAYGLAEARGERSRDNLIKEFETTNVFWQQFEVAKMLVQHGDKSALPALEPWLSNEDRHARCVAAYVFAGLGLEKFGATEALPQLHALLNDQEKTYFGAQVSVADSAKSAIAVLEGKR